MFQISCLFMPEMGSRIYNRPHLWSLVFWHSITGWHVENMDIFCEIIHHHFVHPQTPQHSMFSVNKCMSALPHRSCYPIWSHMLFVTVFSKLIFFVLSPPMATILTLPLHVLHFVLYMCLICFSKFGFPNSFTCLFYIYSQPCVFC